jgi:hypothetical protein
MSTPCHMPTFTSDRPVHVIRSSVASPPAFRHVEFGKETAAAVSLVPAPRVDAADAMIRQTLNG